MMKLDKKDRIFGYVAMSIVILGVVVVLILFVGSVVSFFYPQQYVTTDLADYGKYVGNYDNKSANKFITSFFPDEISDDFQNVKYSYRAREGDAYAFEAYLEFQIEDETAFESYIAENIGDGATAFEYDPDYKEYVLADALWLASSDRKGISYAKIGKILYSEKEQRIIYVALAVFDGAGATADFLCVYFERFGIDPVAYQRGEYEASLAGK